MLHCPVIPFSVNGENPLSPLVEIGRLLQNSTTDGSIWEEAWDSVLKLAGGAGSNQD